MMHKIKLFSILSLLCLLVCGTAVAQSVESQISSTQMIIGEQVAIKVTVHANDTSHVRFPDKLLLPTEVELLGTFVEDDLEKSGNGMKDYIQSYVLTSFADADTLYSLPPIQVMIDGKVFETKPLALKLLTIDVDTTKVEQFYGPKDVRPLPFSWKADGWDTILYLSIVLIVLVLVTGYLIMRLLDNKPIVSRIRIVRHIPPHQKAMKVIEEIKAEKMSTSEDPKQYYTKLTDTLRQYINERYGFNAMEMTSSEIIDRLTHTDDPKSLEELKILFQTADLVKFAKYSTLINENDANLVNAIDFINETKQENMPTEEVIKPELTAQQQRSKANRRALQITIGILSLVFVALLTYVIWTVYDFLN